MHISFTGCYKLLFQGAQLGNFESKQISASKNKVRWFGILNYCSKEPLKGMFLIKSAIIKQNKIGFYILGIYDIRCYNFIQKVICPFDECIIVLNIILQR